MIFISFIDGLEKGELFQYPDRYPNWVPHLGTQQFQLTPEIVAICSYRIILYDLLGFTLYFFNPLHIC